MNQSFRISHPNKEGTFQASRWISYRVLLDDIEMEDLLFSLPPFSFYNVSEIIDPKGGVFSRKDFLREYRLYIGSLKRGELYRLPKPMFSSAMSATSEAFYAMDVKKGVILKLLKPVIQLSLHHFTYSSQDQAFHFMVHSQKSITWGLQFSYPGLYSNSVKGDLFEVMKEHAFPNTALFKRIVKWMRHHSRPTPFLIKEKRVNIEARLGLKCFSWIGNHPELGKNHLEIQGIKT